jgi:hypothetical protein
MQNLDSLFGVLSISAGALSAESELFFQTRLTDFEKFIEAGAKDKQKHEAFEQRMILVFRLLEDSQTKFKIA